MKLTKYQADYFRSTRMKRLKAIIKLGKRKVYLLLAVCNIIQGMRCKVHEDMETAIYYALVGIAWLVLSAAQGELKK